MYKCDNCDNIFEKPKNDKSPCCEDDYTEATECVVCKINYANNHADLCDECLRDVESTMYEAQVCLGVDYNTFKWLVQDWIERS